MNKDFGAVLESVLNRLVVDLEKQDVELSYNVQFYASKRGMRATVQLCVAPKQSFFSVCPQPQKE